MSRVNIIKISVGKKEDVKSFANRLSTIYNENRIKEKIVRRQKTAIHE
ncbi:MAG: hypothetical protein M0P14_05630 [Alkaliphilus sp.]|nr:hypothetical protein [Alkaliphilus sp.]